MNRIVVISQGEFVTVDDVQEFDHHVQCRVILNPFKGLFGRHMLSPSLPHRYPHRPIRVKSKSVKISVDIGPSTNLAVRLMSGSTYCAKDVAEHLGVTRATFYNMLKDGRFSVAPIPGTDPRRWRVDEVVAVWGERAGGGAE